MGLSVPGAAFDCENVNDGDVREVTMAKNELSELLRQGNM